MEYEGFGRLSLCRDYASEQFAQHIGEVKVFCGAAAESERAACAGAQVGTRVACMDNYIPLGTSGRPGNIVAAHSCSRACCLT